MTEKERSQAQTDVSRETLEMLEIYARLLAEWTKRINLVSRSTLDALWTRHFLDSAQLIRHIDTPGLWADLGSGGGFPGAVVAILQAGKREVVLVESDQRKAAFLRAVARETVGFRVVAQRIEQAKPLAASVVSARALAPLPVLLEYVHRHLAPGGVAVLPKGRKADEEITAALEHWRFDCEKHPSQTDPESVVLILGDIKRV